MSGNRLENIIFKKDKQAMKINWGKKKTRLQWPMNVSCLEEWALGIDENADERHPFMHDKSVR